MLGIELASKEYLGVSRKTNSSGWKIICIPLLVILNMLDKCMVLGRSLILHKFDRSTPTKLSFFHIKLVPEIQGVNHLFRSMMCRKFHYPRCHIQIHKTFKLTSKLMSENKELLKYEQDILNHPHMLTKL